MGANSLESIHSLNRLLDQIQSLNPLVEYILFPLIQILNRPLTDEQNVLTIIKVLSLSTVPIPASFFRQLLLKLPIINASNSEELRLAISTLIMISFERRDESIDLGITNYQPILAHNIAMLLDFITIKSYLQLKVKSIECLMEIFMSIGDPDRIAQFLPGVLSGLMRLIFGKEKENHKVLVLSYSLVSYAIVTSMAETVEIKAILQQEFIEVNVGTLNESSREKEKGSLLRRDKMWFMNTGDKLLQIMPRLLSHRSHSNEQVRRAVAKMCKNIVLGCSLTLKKLHCILTETIVYSSSLIDLEDLRPNVWFQISLDTNLNDILIDFSSVSQGTSDKQKLEKLTLVASHLEVMGDGAKVIVESHQDELVKGLIELLKPDISNTRLIQEASITTLDLAGKNIGFPLKHFDAFQDQNIYKSIQRVCKSLKGGSMVNTISTYLTNIETRYQAILLLNEFMVEGYWLESLISEYLSLESTPTSSFKVVLDSAVMEGLALAAPNLNATQIQNVMMDGLYLMLEKLGDSNDVVASSAAATLTAFSKGKSIGALVVDHVDYLVDSVSHKLRYITANPISTRVLVAAIKVSGIELIGPLVTDCVDQVLDILDTIGTGGVINKISTVSAKTGRKSLMGGLVEVLQTVLKTIQNSIPAKASLSIQDTSGPSNEMKAFVLREKKFEDELSVEETKQSARDFFLLKEENEGKIEEVERQHEVVEVLTSNETLTLTVVDRAVYFLSADSALIRASVLQLIDSGLCILEDQPITLYPLIHRVWPLVVRKCQDPSPFVILEALRVVATIASTGQEFVRLRMQDDILVHLLKLFKDIQAKTLAMVNMRKKSEIKIERGISRHVLASSVEDDLFKQALRTLKQIIVKVPLSTDQSGTMIFILISFLNSSLYAFNQSVVDLLECLIKTNSDWVWALLFITLGGKSFGSIILTEKDRELYKPFGRAQDFKACYALFPCFDEKSRSLLTSLI